jgi:LuxR family maltose regulon positive regulatory protein
VEARQLRFGVAARYLAEALRLAEQHVGPNSIAAALPASLISRIHYEQGRVEEAEAMLVDRLPFINVGAMLECVLNAYFTMVRVAALRKNFDRAHTLLERAESLGWTRDWVRLCAAVDLERVWLYLQEGRISEGVVAHERMVRLAEKYPPSVDFAWSGLSRYSALAGAYLASSQGRFEDAIARLTGLREDSARVQNHFFTLRVAAHLSVVRFSANQVAEALDELRWVLNASASAGIQQTILDEGPKIEALLDAFREDVERSGKSRELMPFVSSLVATLRSRDQSGTRLGPKSVLADPLSAREGAILKLIGQGLSNKEIARNLAIAPETVKSHVKHIFTKLGAEKRAQAVTRAQSFGLLTTV